MTGLCLPDFIIGGAPRSATTWLYQLADRHPDIAMAKPLQPEPKFFLVDELYARGLEHYAATWFAPLPPGRLLGEKSTNYLESPHAAERIRRCLPGVRLIFLLRNPVDRAYSNYLWSKRNGLETEGFEHALAMEDARTANLPAALRYARPFSYVSRGLYAEHLARFLRLFPRQQVLVLRTEDIASDPNAVADRLQLFLGVDVVPGLAAGLGTINVSVPDGAPPMPAAIRAMLEARYRAPNTALRALLGDTFPMW